MTVHEWLTILLIGVASNLDNAGVGIAYGVRQIVISPLSNLTIAAVSFAATLLSGFFGQATSRFLSPHVASLIGTVVLIVVGLWVLLQPIFCSRTDKTFATTDLTEQEIVVASSTLEKTATSEKQAGRSLVTILRNPETADVDQSKSISLSEALILGIALAMNALAGGFDAGVTGVDIWLTSLSVGVLSYLLLGSAAFIGQRYVADKLGDRATIVAGILLIAVGLHQMM